MYRPNDGSYFRMLRITSGCLDQSNDQGVAILMRSIRTFRPNVLLFIWTFSWTSKPNRPSRTDVTVLPLVIKSEWQNGNLWWPELPRICLKKSKICHLCNFILTKNPEIWTNVVKKITDHIYILNLLPMDLPLGHSKTRTPLSICLSILQFICLYRLSSIPDTNK